MAISDADFDRIMGAARPAEDSSPSAISDEEFNKIFEGAGSHKQTTEQPKSEGNSTLGEALGKGGLTGMLNTITTNISDYVESEFPGALSGQSGVPYSEAFLNATPQERREYFKAQRAAVINNYYGDVDTSNHEVANFLGQLAGSMVDVTSLLAPVNQGNTIAARAWEMSKFGGAMGAAAGAAEGLADEGSIDPIHVAVTTAIGAAAGGTIQFGLIEPLTKLASKFSARGRPITPDEVEKAVEDVTEPIEGIDTIKVADDLNEQLGLKEKTPEQAKVEAEVDNILGTNVQSQESIDLDYRMAKADEFFEGRLKDRLPESKPVTFGKPADGEFDIDNAIDKQMMEAQDIIDMINETPLRQQVIRDVDQAMPDKELAMTKSGDEKIVMAVGDEMVPADSTLGQKIEASDIADVDLMNPKPQDYQTITQKFGREWGLTRPDKTWESIGPAGREASQTINDFTVKARRAAASKFLDYQRVIISNKLSKEEEKLMTQVLAKTATGDIPKNVAKAAEQVRQQFNGFVKEYVNKGLITAAKGTELLENARDNGYFPHVYNRNLLNTPKGRADFVKAIAETPFLNKGSAETAVKSILGQKKIGKMSNYIREVKKGDGTVSYFVNPELARYLWKNQTTVSERSMSSHLEMSRKFPKEMEEALQPFLERDPQVAMDRYIRDTVERLEASKIYGNDFSRAKEIFKKMYEVSPERALSFREVFWATMNDPRSKNIQSFATRSKVVTNAVNTIKSLQLLKLTFSQVTNLTQPFVNGWTTVANSKGVNAAQKLKIGLEGIMNGYASKLGAKDMLDEAKMAGAMVDSVLMHSFGAINPESRAGKYLIGPLAILKDPSLFLKYTGFQFTEDLNRATGYHMGKGYIESLLKNRAKYEAMGNRVNPKKLEEVYKALEEFGIPRNMPIDQVSLKAIKDGAYKIQDFNEDLRNAILEGGQRFSNKINHVNDYHKLPIFATSFVGKLMFQLHTFSYHQMHFAMDNVIKPALKGNFLPLAVYLGVGTAIGMPLNEFRRFILADDSKLTNTEKILQSQMSVAGLGLVQDMVKSSTYGKQGIYSALAGPGIAQAVTIGAGIGSGINVALKNVEEKGNPFKGGNVLQPVGKAVLSTVAFPYKREVLKNMKQEKDAFDAKMRRLEGKLDRGPREI